MNILVFHETIEENSVELFIGDCHGSDRVPLTEDEQKTIRGVIVEATIRAIKEDGSPRLRPVQ